MGKEIKKKSQSKTGKTSKSKTVKTAGVSKETVKAPEAVQETSKEAKEILKAVPEVLGESQGKPESREKPEVLKATFNYYHRWVVVDGQKEVFCPRCGGWGPVYEPNCYRRECPDCKGNGKIAGPLKAGQDAAGLKSMLVWQVPGDQVEKKAP